MKHILQLDVASNRYPKDCGNYPLQQLLQDPPQHHCLQSRHLVVIYCILRNKNKTHGWGCLMPNNRARSCQENGNNVSVIKRICPRAGCISGLIYTSPIVIHCQAIRQQCLIGCIVIALSPTQSPKPRDAVCAFINSVMRPAIPKWEGFIQCLEALVRVS